MNGGVMITIDDAQCRRIAERLDRVEVRPDAFAVRPATAEERRREANLLLYLVGICQSTRTLQGTLDGRWYRGWDYMARAARRALAADPEAFSAERLAAISGDALRAILADAGDPASSTLDRIDERVAQLHDAARLMLDRYGGDVMALYEAAGRRVEGEGGILARLAECNAYRDPVRKKAFLLTMFLVESGVWEVRDLENLRVAIDYHIMRIALRSGIVRVEDADLAARLRDRGPVSEEEDNAIREAVREACHRIVGASRQTVFAVDNILWSMGRNCCFYDYDPICGPNACTRRDVCTFVTGIDYDCPGRCLFDGVCLGSREADYRAYWETNLYTDYY